LASSLSIRRAKCGDDFALIAAVDAEVRFIHRDHQVPRIEFAHPNQAQISEVRMTVFITSSEVMKRSDLARAIECHANDAALQHFQKVSARLQVEGTFCQHGFASKQRQLERSGKALRPPMMLVVQP